MFFFGNSASHGGHYPLDGNSKDKKHLKGKGELPGEKLFPFPLCPSHIPHVQLWE
jgi:hypothetical protein